MCIGVRVCVVLCVVAVVCGEGAVEGEEAEGATGKGLFASWATIYLL